VRPLSRRKIRGKGRISSGVISAPSAAFVDLTHTEDNAGDRIREGKKCSNKVKRRDDKQQIKLKNLHIEH
jgi:hypothetical protein